MRDDDAATSFYARPCRHGLGLFAARDIDAGELILKFTGSPIGLEAALAKGDLEGNVLQVGPVEFVDIEPPGVLANHSCEPNSGVHADMSLVAIDFIPANEEILYDYSTTMLEAPGTGWTMHCQCGAPSCRGVLRDFAYLPDLVRERYLRLNIVQKFIVERANGDGFGAYFRNSED